MKLKRILMRILTVTFAISMLFLVACNKAEDPKVIFREQNAVYRVGESIDLKDLDVIKIGDKQFAFYETPGHTQGTLTMYFNVSYNGKDYIAGMFGGAGINSLSKNYLDKYNLPYTLREDFIKSIERIYDLVPDVHIGNHLDNNCHFEKLKKATEKCNPFIDRTSWKYFLDNKKREAKEFFKKDKL